MNRVLLNLQKHYQQDPYPSLEKRIARLDRLAAIVDNNQQQICEAISNDFGHRAAQETLLLEINPLLSAISHAKRKLKKWMRPRHHFTGILFPARAKVFAQPLGVIGIIAPWNYPLLLALSPLVSALAAGNVAMVKLSEKTRQTSKLIAYLFKKNFPEDQVAIINGNVDVSQAFSALPFDHLIMTGSPTIGRTVMMAASQHLTPVTLELGGKSPVILDDNANWDNAIARIIWGKCINSGQTCLAPDYIFVPRARQAEFVEKAIRQFQQFYPHWYDNSDYSSLLDKASLQRANDLITDAKNHGAEITSIDEDFSEHKNNKLPLHCIAHVTDDMQIMQQELFNPILPIIGFDDFSQALAYIKQRPKPLALYYFGSNSKHIKKIQYETLSGALCINNTIIHAGIESLPFGGVGRSGMGAYHGYTGFKQFSKLKPIVTMPTFKSPARLLYPPYRCLFKKAIRWLIGG